LDGSIEIGCKQKFIEMFEKVTDLNISKSCDITKPKTKVEDNLKSLCPKILISIIIGFLIITDGVE
jgi:hypothetical protein